MTYVRTEPAVFWRKIADSIDVNYVRKVMRREYRVPEDESTFIGLDDLRHAASVMMWPADFSMYLVGYGGHAAIGCQRQYTFHEWKERMEGGVR